MKTKVSEVQIPYHLYMDFKALIGKCLNSEVRSFVQDAFELHDQCKDPIVLYKLGPQSLPDIYGYMYCMYLAGIPLRDIMASINNGA